MTAARFADSYGVEVCGFEEDVFGVFCYTAFESAEDTGNTHCLFLISDHEVASIHLALYAVESNEFLALACIAHMDLVAFDLVSIEGMERLTHFVQHEVRDIDDVVNRTKTDSQQAVFEPLRRFFHFHTFDVEP